MDKSRISPIYTPENCSTAYQLDWSVTLFWKLIPATDDWLAELMPVTEADGVRILRHRFPTADCSQFLVSSKTSVRPVDVVRSIKGRLQYVFAPGGRRRFNAITICTALVPRGAPRSRNMSPRS